MPDHGPPSLKPGTLYCISPLKALHGTILALSLCVCFCVRIYCEKIHLGYWAIPTVSILSFGLA